MTKYKKWRQKRRAKAKIIMKKKEVVHARRTSTPPPKTSVSSCSQNRSFCFLRSTFSSILKAVMPLMTTGLGLYWWCQNRITQIFRTIQQSVFPCRVCRQELNVLRERVEKLEAELARLPSIAQNGTAFSEKSPCRRSEKLDLTVCAPRELCLSEPLSLPSQVQVPSAPPPPPPLPPPPPPLVPLSFKRKETQVVPLKKDVPMQITLKDLLNVKLKKTHSCTVIDKKGSPFPKQRTAITVSDLQGVNLKSKALQPPARVTNSLITPSKTQLDFRKHLKKVAIQRSPGGTPLTNKENIETGTGLTPLMTQALRRKFQLAHPKSPSPTQLLRGSSFEEQS